MLAIIFLLTDDLFLRPLEFQSDNLLLQLFSIYNLFRFDYFVKNRHVFADSFNRITNKKPETVVLGFYF